MPPESLHPAGQGAEDHAAVAAVAAAAVARSPPHPGASRVGSSCGSASPSTASCRQPVGECSPPPTAAPIVGSSSRTEAPRAASRPTTGLKRVAGGAAAATATHAAVGVAEAPLDRRGGGRDRLEADCGIIGGAAGRGARQRRPAAAGVGTSVDAPPLPAAAAAAVPSPSVATGGSVSTTATTAGSAGRGTAAAAATGTRHRQGGGQRLGCVCAIGRRRKVER